MRNIYLLVAFFFLSSFRLAQAADKPLHVGWELWYPYQYRDKNQQLVGLDFDIFHRIVEQANVSVNYTELPWKRHLLFIKNGKMDIAMGSSKTKEREQYAYFTEPYRKETIKLFVRQKFLGVIQIANLRDLLNSNYLIGVEGGYYYGEQYQQLIQQVEFQSHINEVIDIEQNILMLMKDRIDGVLVDPVTMKSFVEKYRLENEFIALPFTIYESSIHLMLSKKSSSPELVNKFNQAIAQLSQDGTLDTIINKWTQLNDSNARHQ
jgi:polar amino acid transport system substrate-binding protein